jgi:hypothetical protein
MKEITKNKVQLHLIIKSIVGKKNKVSEPVAFSNRVDSIQSIIGYPTPKLR